MDFTGGATAETAGCWPGSKTSKLNSKLNSAAAITSTLPVPDAKGAPLGPLCLAASTCPEKSKPKPKTAACRACKRPLKTPRIRQHTGNYFLASSACTSLTTAASSGLTRGPKRPMTLPSRPNTNFSKFQATLPGPPLGLASDLVRCW